MRLLSGLFFVVFAIGTAMGHPWRFQKYPATVFQGVPARPRLETPLAKDHATIIREGARRGVNFAGEYRVIDWGCGTSCGVYVIVDKRTGKVFEPPEMSKGVDLGVAGPEFRLDSRLMVIANCPDPKIYGLKNCQRKFYEWNGSRLVLLKTEPVGSPEKNR